jgi:transcriptional regulator with XRE-family HTH domain
MEAHMKINGQAVRSLREQKSWSQEHLASASGLSVRTIQRVEVESAGSAETRLALAAAFDVPVADLVYEVPESTNSTGVRLHLPRWGWIGLGAVLSIVIAVVLLFVFRGLGPDTVEYSTFLSQVRQDQIQRVTFDGDTIRGLRRSGEQFVVYNPEIDNRALIDTLRSNNVLIRASEPEQVSFLTQMFISSLPILLLMVILSFPVLLMITACIYYMRRMWRTGAGA